MTETKSLYCKRCRNLLLTTPYHGMCLICYTERRYHLHKQVRYFCKVNTYQKQVNITEKILSELTVWQLKYLDELKEYGYNLQFTIE